MIDTLCFAENGEVHAISFREADKSLEILGEAETAEPEAGTEEVRADARIQTDAVQDFLDIRAELLGEIGDHVGVRNLEGEEGIRGVLDELGAIDRGDEPGRWVRGRAGGTVRRANEFLLENRLVDFMELPSGDFVFDPDNDTIGMKEVGDGGAFAEKFGIGGHTEVNSNSPAIVFQGALELLASLSGNCAFFDDELVGSGFGGDHSGDTIDSTEVGITVWKRRRADTDENDIAGDGARKIGGER